MVRFNSLLVPIVPSKELRTRFEFPISESSAIKAVAYGEERGVGARPPPPPKRESLTKAQVKVISQFWYDHSRPSPNKWVSLPVRDADGKARKVKVPKRYRELTLLEGYRKLKHQPSFPKLNGKPISFSTFHKFIPREYKKAQRETGMLVFARDCRDFSSYEVFVFCAAV